MKIRKGTFETNSSSTHSIAISKNKVNIPVGTCMNFYIGEYGWEENEYDFPSYMYTALLYNDDVEGLEKLKSILDKWGVKYYFQTPKWCYWGEKKESRYLDNGYIDHGNETFDIMKQILEDEDLLARALFGDSTVYTGNDNSSENDSMCYCADEYVYDWDSEEEKLNPNHDSEHYDYFFKGN